MITKIQKINIQTAALLTVATLGLTSPALAQNISISPTGNPPHNSAALDIRDFTNKGLLIPRIALTSNTDVTTIPAPALSLLVYNTGTGGLTPAGYYYWNGSRWVRLVTMGGTPSDAWLTLGNAGTNPATHFVGTTDNVALVFRTNNTEKMRITAGGNVGIGTTAPNYPLSFGSALANTKLAIWDGGAGGTAFGLGVQNNQFRFHVNQPSDRFSFLNGAAGTEIVTILGSGNVGIGTTAPSYNLHVNNQLGVGVAGSTSGRIGIFPPNTGSWFWIDNDGNNYLRFSSGATPGGNPVVITSAGNVGIGTTSPTAKLHVNGTFRYTNGTEGAG